MTRAPLRWRPSVQSLALALVATLATAGSLALRSPELLALATPALWALLTRQSVPEPRSVALDDLPDVLVEEGSSVTLSLGVGLDVPVVHLAASLQVPDELDGEVRGSASGRSVVATGEVTALRWGRRRLGPLQVACLGPLGLRRADVDVVVRADALVRPAPLGVRASSAPALLPDRTGEHVSRLSGSGIEPLGGRPWAYGDEARRIDWRATGRRGALHVTVTAAERSVDLVLLVDALSDVGAAPASSLDRAVRAAAGMANRWLRDRDRVGLVVLGGSLRWLTPATGAIQELRVADAVLQASLPPGDVPPDLQRVPAQVVPAGCVVVALTPLLDPRALDALVTVRQRTRRVVVVDVLDVEPEVGPDDPIGALALRLWRLDRAATVDRLSSTGTPVLRLGADAGGELDRLVALALRGVR